LRSSASGAGLVSILGIHAATLVHVAAAAAGLSALLAYFAIAFSVVKYAGAAYLIWLGFKKLFGPAIIPDVNGGPAAQSPTHFPRGFPGQPPQSENRVILSRLSAAVC